MQIYISNFKLWRLKLLAYVKKYHIHLPAFINKIGQGVQDKYYVKFKVKQYIQFSRPSVF